MEGTNAAFEEENDIIRFCGRIHEAWKNVLWLASLDIEVVVGLVYGLMEGSRDANE